MSRKQKINICGYEFELFNDPEDIDRKLGVYVILCIVDGKIHCVLDIGASFGGYPATKKGINCITDTSNLNYRISYHDRKRCWEENKHGTIAYAVHYISDTSSKINAIERELQWKLEYVCGDNYWKNVERAWQEYKEYEKRFGERGSFKFKRLN